MDLIDLIDIQKRYPDLLLKPDENNYHAFCHTLQIAFDVPDEIGCAWVEPMTGLMYHVTNRDLIWRPNLTKNVINYYHWATFESDQRDPIWSMYSYLFERCEPYYQELYELSAEETNLRIKFYEYLRSKYEDVGKYVVRIKNCLYLDQLSDHGISIDTLRKRVW